MSGELTRGVPIPEARRNKKKVEVLYFLLHYFYKKHLVIYFLDLIKPSKSPLEMWILQLR